MHFIRHWHEKRRFSWPFGRWKSEEMLGRVVKVEKSEEMCCENRKKRTILGRLWLFGKGKNRLLFRRLWNAVITSRHKMEMKYSDKGTLVQRQRYPLPSRSLRYWPMNRCVRKNPKLNGNPKNIIISISALSTLKNLNNIWYSILRWYTNVCEKKIDFEIYNK